jgi:pimeloyl-ACP methyl ester carboxylesterase
MYDLVVVVPGILGSELRRGCQLLWGFPEGIAGLLAARADLRAAIEPLTLKGDDPRREVLDDEVTATRLVSVPQVVAGLIKSDGYDRLRERLREHFQLWGDEQDGPVNYVEFPYDWRRDNRAAAHRLAPLVEERLSRWRRDTGDTKAKVIFICHSMGGLVARYYLERLGGRDRCRALITMGTPYRGAVNALDFLVRGYQTAGVELTEVLRSCTSIYQLLPTYRVIDVDGTYRRVEGVGRMMGRPDLVDPRRARAARAFHREVAWALRGREGEGYLVFPIAGVDQPTLQSAAWVGGALAASEHVPDDWPTTRATGDGTVPYISSIPPEMSRDPRGWLPVPGRHAMLQSNERALDYIVRILEFLQDETAGAVWGIGEPVQSEPAIELRLSDRYPTGAPITIRARVVRGRPGLDDLVAEVSSAATGGTALQEPMARAGDVSELVLPPLDPGLYWARVETAYQGLGRPEPIEDVFEVGGPP